MEMLVKPFEFELTSAKGTMEGERNHYLPSRDLTCFSASKTNPDSAHQFVGDQYPQVSRDDDTANES